MRRFILVIAVLSVVALSSGGCSDDETGACVWNGSSGYDFKCWNDFSSGKCDQMNGTLYVGETCEGLKKSNPSGSLLALSEVNIHEGLEWIEIYNGSPIPIDLRGTTLVVSGAGGQAEFALDGVVAGCSTFVAGRPSPAYSPSAPFLEYDLNEESLDRTRDITAIRLHAPDGRLLDEVVSLSGIMEGSIERTGWPGSDWATRSVADPNRVPSSFKCLAKSGTNWKTIAGVYR